MAKSKARRGCKDPRDHRDPGFAPVSFGPDPTLGRNTATFDTRPRRLRTRAARTRAAVNEY